jgi:hypothetical protein
MWFNTCMQRFSRLDPLSLVAYLTLAGVTAAGLWEIDRILMRWLALGLLAAFGVLHSRLPEQEGSPECRRPANLVRMASRNRQRHQVVPARAAPAARSINRRNRARA